MGEDTFDYEAARRYESRHAAVKFAIDFSGNGFERIESEEVLRDAQKYYEFLTADLEKGSKNV